MPGKPSALVRVLGGVSGPRMPTFSGRAPMLPAERGEEGAASQS